MKLWKKSMAFLLSAVMVTSLAPVQPKAEAAGTEESTVTQYEGYNLVWNDEFNGDTLNRNDWNVEQHEAGWVNAELQEYVDTEENIYLEDGKLVLMPKQTYDVATGKYSYTSGRISTQNKQTFTYGKFEARLKVPEGKGYLPAFWLMANDENTYGQWPRCGEIDIMEVLGDKPAQEHGTIHYGNPHQEQQGTYTLAKGDFSDDFHVFTCEWEPGKITWYVDGKKFHEVTDWYSATEGGGTISYPAPFDQPFYVILNLAVGGTWVGYPDNARFEAQPYEIDYVRVYQKKAGYDETAAQKPEKTIVMRESDESGNYLLQGDFETADDLSGSGAWQFKTANNGAGSAVLAANKDVMNAINGNSAIITTTNDGDVDYSIQLVQQKVPFKAGATYRLSFDAYAAADRKMLAVCESPANSWHRYLEQEISLTTTSKTYSYDFEMIHSDDPDCCVEFNMGNTGSDAGIVIDNVKLTIVNEDAEKRASIMNPPKTVRADGNYIYNGKFEEGNTPRYLGDWNIPEGKNISVTSLADNRRLKVESSANEIVTITQTAVPVAAESDYELSLDAEIPENGTMKILFDGKTYEVTTENDGSYHAEFTTGKTISDRTFTISFQGAGTFYLDNVRIDEAALIKNGSFNAGFAGYETFVDTGASATYVVDSQSEENAADFTINNTSDADWKIQLKQTGVELKKDQWYKLSFKVKSSRDRKISYAIQRDGSIHDNDWTPYVQQVVEVSSEYQVIEKEFQMTEDTDPASVFNIALGAVDGEIITEQHRVCIDDIVLEKINGPELVAKPYNENLMKNTDFSNGTNDWSATIGEGDGASGSITTGNGMIRFDITNPGNHDYSVQMIQNGIPIEKGKTYAVWFYAQSDETRVINSNVMSKSAPYDWYGGSGDVTLEAGVLKPVLYTFTMQKDTNPEAAFFLSMGKFSEETPASEIMLFGFHLAKLDASGEAAIAARQRIYEIGSISADKECKARIDAARAAYDALAPEAKALIDAKAQQLLTGSEQAYQQLTGSSTGNNTGSNTGNNSGSSTGSNSGSSAGGNSSAGGTAKEPVNDNETPEKPEEEEKSEEEGKNGDEGKENAGKEKDTTNKPGFSAKTTKIQAGKSSKSLALDIQVAKGDKIVGWYSSKKSVLSVNRKTGKLKAKKSGTAVITVVTEQGKEMSITVEVVAKKVKTEQLEVTNKKIEKALKNHSAVTLKKEKTLQLQTALTPVTSPQKVKYETSDPQIATVTSDGRIIAGTKKGTVTITVKSGKKSVQIQVKVK